MVAPDTAASGDGTLPRISFAPYQQAGSASGMPGEAWPAASLLSTSLSVAATATVSNNLNRGRAVARSITRKSRDALPHKTFCHGAPWTSHLTPNQSSAQLAAAAFCP